jgi:replicative DNA helicase
MTREQARQEINHRISELPQAKKKVNGRDTYICPFCGNGSGKEGDGIATTDDIHYKCFRCNFYGDYLDILRKRDNLKEWEVFERYDISVDGDPAQTRSRAHTESMAQAPLPEEPQLKQIPHYKNAIIPPTFTLYHSGISGQSANTQYPHRVEVKDKESFAAAMIYDHVAASYIKNARGKDNFIASDCVMMDIDNDKTDNPVAWVKENHLKDVFKGVPMYICYSRNHMREKDGKAPRPKFHVYFPIEPVQEAEEYENIKTHLLEVFPAFDAGAKDAARFFFGVESPKVEFYEGSKNILAFLHEKNPERLKYMQENAVLNCLDAFMNGIADSANTPAISTGFDVLDDELDGGLYEGLYIIGAISSLGKTTFCLQVADQIAQQGKDVIIFSLEMSKYELISKSLSRLTIMADKGKNDKGFYYARSNREITAGAKWKYYGEREKLLIKNAVQTYGNEFAPNLYIHEGIGDIGADMIKDTVKRHISITGNKPVVIIDYLQILKPKDIRATDKQNTDIAVTDLKIMSRYYKIPIIGISSFNRDNYLSPVNMSSFKESGAIEYSSDVLLGLQFEGMDEISLSDGDNKSKKKLTDMLKIIDGWRKAKPRKVQLKILKNRNGEAAKNINYDYYAQFNWFTNERVSESKKDWNSKINKE